MNAPRPAAATLLPASLPLRASAPSRQPSLSFRVFRGFLACLIATLVPPLSAHAQEEVAETKSTIKIDTTPIIEAPITDADRTHWSFSPIGRHLVPQFQNSEFRIQNSIDYFILSKLQAKNLSFSPEAARATLFRRLSFDLRGLPPSPAELHDFESDLSPDAYERQIDRLLASPAFGDRYGQYWLDLARFAESDGYEFDTVRPHAWKYRDWVIAALNADVPYDEFVRLQIAGDELKSQASSLKPDDGEALAEPSADPKAKAKKPQAPPPTRAQIPTTFCLAGPDMPDVNDQVERRHGVMNELTATVGSALLGLQMGCAQCHNHKYDPISQADFYRLRAVFESALPAYQRDVPNNVLANQKSPVPARFYIRGDHKRPGLEVPPDFPRIATLARSASEGNAVGPLDPSLALRASMRTEFADWLVNSSNPLTSRVIANRLWQYHFGRGLCTTPSDFGLMGGALTHPELLDYLATDLMGHGWQMKRLHRQILTSATYRQASVGFKVQSSKFKVEDRAPTLNLEHGTLNSGSTDPDNTLYWSFPRQRLSGEAIRDAMLAAAGLLTSERGGPGVMPPLPEELLSTLLKNQWTASKRQADHYKRSVYVFARRNLRYPIFEAFDRPDGNASCPLRSRSTTAPQSLLLFNSELSLLGARHLAGRVLNSAEPKNRRTEEPITSQIDRLYVIALSRRPTTPEAASLERFLTTQRQRLVTEARPRQELALPTPCPDSAEPYAAAALVDACLALLNTNEFIYVD